ncbi:MAG: glycosyltransferase family 4 protein [Vulcanimicrobiota bacterium]
MRIALLNLSAGGLSGGYKKYLYNMLPRLASHPSVNELLCVSPISWNMQDWFIGQKKMRFSNIVPYNLFSNQSRNLIKKALQLFAPDVIFIPIERFFPFSTIPVVNMLLNMEPFAMNFKGNPIDEIIKNIVRSIIVKNALSKSDRVIAISEFVRDFLINTFEITANKIDLIYFGVETDFNLNCVRPQNIPEVLHQRFLFTFGSIRPARGVEDAIQGMKFLRLKNDDQIKGLVIGGEPPQNMLNYSKYLRQIINSYGLNEKIYWTGKMRDDELNWCFKNCSAFIMTSRIEAGPNIALEAMARGCISIAANNPPLPEFFQDTALYYEPGDGKSLAETIESFIELDPEKRTLLSKKARERASQFSWDITAEKTIIKLAEAIRIKENSHTCRNGIK